MKSSQTQDQLIVFTRYPEPGKTKTRLGQTLGHHQAAVIQQELLEYTIDQVRDFMLSYPVSVKIYFVGGTHKKIQEWLGADLTYQDQGRGDLGYRMTQAFAES